MEAGYYAITGVGPSLGSGVSGAFEVQLLGVGKVDTHEPYTLANEFICAQLASALGLPVPPATIAETNTGEKVFVSLKYTVGPTSLPAVDPAELVATARTWRLASWSLTAGWATGTGTPATSPTYVARAG